MNTSEIKRFKIMLESRLAALWGRVRNRNTIAIENTADTMDEVRLAEERDLAIQILGRDFAELRLVEAALARIEDGSYGSCLRCEEAIRSNRLSVMPHAAFCVGCQEVAEQSGMSEFGPLRPQHQRSLSQVNREFVRLQVGLRDLRGRCAGFRHER